MVILAAIAVITYARLIPYAFKDLDKLHNDAIAVVHDSFFTNKKALSTLDQIAETFGDIYVIDKQSRLNIEGFLEREDGKPLYEPVLLYRNDPAGGLDPMDMQFTYENAVQFIFLKSTVPDADLLVPFVSALEVEEKAREINRTKGNITRRHIKLAKEGKMSSDNIALFTPPQLFFFESEDCEPCSVLKYQFLQYVTRNSQTVFGTVVNCDVHIDYCKEMNVTALPSMRMYAKGRWFTYKPRTHSMYAFDYFVKHNAVKEEDIEYAKEMFNIRDTDNSTMPDAAKSAGKDAGESTNANKEDTEKKSEEEPKVEKKRPVPVYRNTTDVGGDDIRRHIARRQKEKEREKEIISKESSAEKTEL